MTTNTTTITTPDSQPCPRAIIVGLSGPSSSGKTTLARLLQRIFRTEEGKEEEEQNPNNNITEDASSGITIRSFIIHEDDFYLPDDKIPLVTNPSTSALIQDWDTISAIDVPSMSSSLDYVKKTGQVPPQLLAITKEDQNEAADHGVDITVIKLAKKKVKDRLNARLNVQRDVSSIGDTERRERVPLTIAFLEGFLLYGPSLSNNGKANTDGDGDGEGEEADLLDSIQRNIHLPIFLPAPYDLVKQRREARSGYVTIGPQPTKDDTKEDFLTEDDKMKDSGQGEDASENTPFFWTDPPGYVDDIVWPRYIEGHAWLLLPEVDSKENDTEKSLLQVARESQTEEKGIDNLPPGLPDTQLLIKLAGQAVNVRTDTRVKVAPGRGKFDITKLLEWAVEEVLQCLDEALALS